MKSLDMTCWSYCCTHTSRCAICLAIALIAFILDVIGFSVPYWYYQNNAGTKMYEGLWKSCTEVGGVMTCVNWVNVDTPAWFKANQAMQTLGMIFLLAALICLLLLLTCNKGDYAVRICALTFLIATATFILIGVIIYGVKSTDVVTNNLNFGFIFVVVAAGLAIFAALCVCIGINVQWADNEA